MFTLLVKGKIKSISAFDQISITIQFELKTVTNVLFEQDIITLDIYPDPTELLTYIENIEALQQEQIQLAIYYPAIENRYVVALKNSTILTNPTC
jgi:hypothetical protein